MKDVLAEKILAKIMNWDASKLRNELADLQIMAELKYDTYQQYTHGKRFIECLALWLKRFDTEQERQTAYEFVKKNMIFISETEMQQLVAVAFDDYIRDKIMIKVKSNYGIHEKELTKKDLYQYYLRKTLFLGLSDGAHIDFFRRHNSFLTNEQIFMHYDYSEGKAKELQKHLNEDLENSHRKLLPIEYFNNYVLLDDFSASGLSYLRKEKDKETGCDVWKGKLSKFFAGTQKLKTNENEISVRVLIYLATKEAISNIEQNLQKYLKENELHINFSVQAVQYIDAEQLPDDFIKLLKEDLDKHSEKDYVSFIDSHFMKGKTDRPYLGFNECGLPLIIYHNTPNNSLPIIWHGWIKKNPSEDECGQEALFPRVTRHKEE